MEKLMVFTNLPDRESALKLAALLLEQRLAACVNLLAPCDSIYHWRGKTQKDTEHPLLIKTTSDRYDALEAAIRAQHPYELPEIVAVGIDRGLPEYLRWLETETRPGVSG